MNSALQKSSAIFRTAAMQVRHSSVTRYIGTPPMVRISTAEKCAHVAVIVGTMLAFPAWVLVHLQDYKKS
uniref:Putative cytochrome c oxidase polypeptide viii n=1 Tax=Ixodes ricinus TaxID=34613 RepID=A0A0K8RG36_IXORI